MMRLLLMEECHYSPSTVNQLAVFVVLFIYLLGYGVSNALWGPRKKKKKSVFGRPLLCGCTVYEMLPLSQEHLTSHLSFQLFLSLSHAGCPHLLCKGFI